MSRTWSMGSRRCPWRWVWRPSWCWSGSSSAQTTTPSWAACIYFWTRLWFYLYLWCKDNAVRKIVTLRSRSWSQSWAQDWVRSRGRREILLKEPRPPGCVEDEQARIFIKEAGTWWVQCMTRLDDQTWWAHWMIRLSMVIFNLLSTSLPSLSRTFDAAKFFGIFDVLGITNN